MSIDADVVKLCRANAELGLALVDLRTDSERVVAGLLRRIADLLAERARAAEAWRALQETTGASVTLRVERERIGPLLDALRVWRATSRAGHAHDCVTGIAHAFDAYWASVPVEVQWEVDKRLGILDAKGNDDG